MIQQSRRESVTESCYLENEHKWRRVNLWTRESNRTHVSMITFDSHLDDPFARLTSPCRLASMRYLDHDRVQIAHIHSGSRRAWQLPIESTT